MSNKYIYRVWWCSGAKMGKNYKDTEHNTKEYILKGDIRIRSTIP